MHAKHRLPRRLHHRAPAPRRARAREWAASLRLAVWMGGLAAAAATVLAEHVADTLLVIGIALVASTVSWARTAPLHPTPAVLRTAPARRR